MVTESEKDTAGHEAGDVYEIEIDGGSADADEAMREAMEAVEARERGETTEADSDVEVEREIGDPSGSNPAGSNPAGSNPAGSNPGDEMQRELEELRERSIRTLADYENFRRRVERERADHRRYAAAEALTGFLTIVDNLERGLQAEGSAEDLRQGIEMIHRQMLELLGRFGASPVQALGERFDPSLHEAVARVEDDSVSTPTVIDEFQRGYRMHDRLLRPSMVRVGVPSGAGRGSEPPPSEDEGSTSESVEPPSDEDHDPREA